MGPPGLELANMGMVVAMYIAGGQWLGRQKNKRMMKLFWRRK